MKRLSAGTYIRENHWNSAPRLLKILSSGLLVASVVAGGLALGATSAQAAGTPTGPQYVYQMVNVSKIASLNKAESLGLINCNRSSQLGTATYSNASTATNTFSFTAGLAFSDLAKLITGKAEISGGVSSSSTVTQAVMINLLPNQCAQVFALRDKYKYTLKQQCRYACGSSGKDWANKGTGTYSKMVGRAFYNV